ncbi:uncharacterized protein TNCV_4735931 [Trichonephila clavipes]|nr:uncharacterized protein TNCV_4735931 [Trichonephila clavipes]
MMMHLFAEDLEDAEIYREKFWELTTKIELKSQQYTKIEELRQRIKCSICYNRWSQGPKQRLVLSFPATAANYPKAIDQLKERFGREDFISTNLRSRPINFVESCLPEEVLVAWEKKQKSSNRIRGILFVRTVGMNPLRQEVKGEEMVLLARTGLTPTRIHEKGLSCNTGQEKLIRAVIDSGSQSTYVNENVITHLKALPLRSETVIHALFGGSETKPKKHDIFPVEETEINLLIGADVLGKLLTWNSVELESGLTAVETKLGWTVFGKGSCVKDNIVTTLSMHSMNIIERVPDLELNKECHYLAHRPVIKLDSQTTKIRPVFDALASEKGKPSLNECLLKGTNLIELIPDILDRFRL